MCWKLNYLILRWSKWVFIFDFDCSVIFFVFVLSFCYVVVMQDSPPKTKMLISIWNNMGIGYVHAETFTLPSLREKKKIGCRCFRYFSIGCLRMFWFSFQFDVLVVNRYYIQFFFSLSILLFFTLLTSTWLVVYMCLLRLNSMVSRYQFFVSRLLFLFFSSPPERLFSVLSLGHKKKLLPHIRLSLEYLNTLQCIHTLNPITNAISIINFHIA